MNIQGDEFMKSKPEFVLASYVTYKELYKCEKYRSPYQILGEFIKYIIYENRIYQFSCSEMKKRALDTFGFKIPNAVLKTTLKKLDCIAKLGGQEEYSVDYEKIQIDPSFEVYKNNAEKDNACLIEELIEHTEHRIKNKLSDIQKENLSSCFMAYLLDESNGGEYQDSISTFIIKYSENKEYEEKLQAVREGCILYTGITNSIDEIGSVTEEIVLYLDMEILFDIYGYNGHVFQSLALDMYKLVQDANKRTKCISLKYFKDTKIEIEDFFKKAQDIVAGKTLLKENVAMKAITTGCYDATDVLDRQSDFFYVLQYKYGITEDSSKSYYDEAQYQANLEGILLEGIEGDKEQIEQSVKFVSNINKLRNNKVYFDYLKSRYIFVTETWKTLEVSRKIIEQIKEENSEEKGYAGYAVNMSFITNILWYKLNNKFGVTEFPRNVNAVIKAKIVLSNYISQNIAYNYEECKKNFDEGKISKEQYAARVVALRNRNIRPEEITVESVEEDLDFSPENITRFEEESKWQKVQLEEQSIEIEELKKANIDANTRVALFRSELLSSKDENSKKDDILQKQEKDIEEKDNIIVQQKLLIEKYEKKERENEEKKKYRKKCFNFVIQIFVRFLFLVALSILSFLITKAIKADMATSVSIIVTIVGIFISCVDIVKNVHKKCFNEMK